MEKIKAHINQLEAKEKNEVISEALDLTADITKELRGEKVDGMSERLHNFASRLEKSGVDQSLDDSDEIRLVAHELGYEEMRETYTNDAS